MIFLMFLIGLVFMGICLFLGASQRSFAFVYLGFFIMLVMGLFVFSEGIDVENGIQESPVGSHNFVTVYETHTTQNDFVINLIANTFFYLPLAGILLSTLVAIRGR